MHGTDSPRLPKSVVTRFIKSYNIKLRRVQRKKTVNKLSHLPNMMTWHTTLREGLIKTGSHLPYYDTKWGTLHQKEGSTSINCQCLLPLTAKQLSKSIYRKPKSVIIVFGSLILLTTGGDSPLLTLYISVGRH